MRTLVSSIRLDNRSIPIIFDTDAGTFQAQRGAKAYANPLYSALLDEIRRADEDRSQNDRMKAQRVIVVTMPSALDIMAGQVIRRTEGLRAIIRSASIQLDFHVFLWSDAGNHRYVGRFNHDQTIEVREPVSIYPMLATSGVLPASISEQLAQVRGPVDLASLSGIDHTVFILGYTPERAGALLAAIDVIDARVGEFGDTVKRIAKLPTRDKHTR